jgi:hypothetical protein
MELAAKTVGKLALVSGTYAAEYVEFEVKRAFEWLGGDRHEGKRHAAVRYAMCRQNCDLFLLISVLHTSTCCYLCLRLMSYNMLLVDGLYKVL